MMKTMPYILYENIGVQTVIFIYLTDNNRNLRVQIILIIKDENKRIDVFFEFVIFLFCYYIFNFI